MEQIRSLTLKVVQNGSKELAYENQQQLLPAACTVLWPVWRVGHLWQHFLGKTLNILQSEKPYRCSIHNIPSVVIMNNYFLTADVRWYYHIKLLPIYVFVIGNLFAAICFLDIPVKKYFNLIVASWLHHPDIC